MSADKTNTTFTKIFTDRDNRNNEDEEVSFIVAASWPCWGRIVAISWPYRGRIVAVSWPYRGRIVALSWPYRGPIVALSWPLLFYQLSKKLKPLTRA